MESFTVLSNTPHIIENIFKNLSALDLCKCACVNKLWNNFSTAEFTRRRKKTVHFYQKLKCSFHKRDHSIITECLMKVPGRFEKEFDEQIRNLEIKPAFCIAFANWTFWENFESLFPSHPVPKPKCKKLKKAVDDTSRQNYFESVIKTALKKRLPRGCEVCLFFGEAVVDTKCDPERVHSNKQVPALTGYFFPEIQQQGIQFCKRKNYDRQVFRTMTSRNDMKSALVLMEHKTIGYFSLGLQQILKTFDVFENGIVFPVQIGSLVVPLFYGTNVETAIVNIPISNDKDSTIAEEMESKGAIGLIFGKCFSFMKDCKKFHEEYPLISIAGMFSSSESIFQSKEESGSKKRMNTELENLDCKCVLISIKY